MSYLISIAGWCLFALAIVVAGFLIAGWYSWVDDAEKAKVVKFRNGDEDGEV